MSVPENSASAPKAVLTDKKPQMLISTGLRAYLADILTIQLENLDEDGCKKANDMAMIKVLEKEKRGQPAAMQALVNFLANSENPLVVDRKPPAIGTVTEWIDINIGRAELERQVADAAAGGNSAKEDIPSDATAWAYLLKMYDEFKVEGAKVTRCNRYTRVPDHLKDS